MKETKIMQQYEAYKDSGVPWIGEIPVEWKVVRLKHYLSANDGGVWGEDPSLDGKDTLVLRSTEQTASGKWDINEPALRCLTNVQNIEQVLLKENDLLMTKSSGSTLHIGKTTLVDREIEDMRCAYSNFMQRIRVQQTESPRYYWYLLNSDFVRSEYEYLQNSTSGLGNLSASLINELVLPRCQPLEQQAIANWLDEKTAEIDGIVEDCEREVELLREYRKAVISEAVTKGLDSDVPMKDSGVEWIGEIPEGWIVCPLKYSLSENMQYGAVETGCEYDENLPRYIRITDIDSNGYLKNNEAKSLELALAEPYLLKDNDILFARSGGTVGKAFFYRESYGLAAFAGYLIKARTDKTKLLPRYLDFWTHSGCYENWKYRVFSQATIQNIGADKYSQMCISIGDIETQQQVVDFLEAKTSNIDTLINTRQEMIEKLKEYRKSIISEAVTGKFKVPGI